MPRTRPRIRIVETNPVFAADLEQEACDALPGAQVEICGDPRALAEAGPATLVFWGMRVESDADLAALARETGRSGVVVLMATITADAVLPGSIRRLERPYSPLQVRALLAEAAGAEGAA